MAPTIACLLEPATLYRWSMGEAKKDEEILCLKDTPPKFSSFFQGQFQGLVWKFLAFDEFSRTHTCLFCDTWCTGTTTYSSLAHETHTHSIAATDTGDGQGVLVVCHDRMMLLSDKSRPVRGSGAVVLSCSGLIEVIGGPYRWGGARGMLSGLNDKLSSFDASFAKSKAKGKERKKKIKSLTKSLDNLHTEVARLSADLNRATVLEAKKDEEILCLKDTPPKFSSFFQGQFQGLVQMFLASDEFSRVQGELLSLVASARFERGLSKHQTKDEFAAVLKKMAYFIFELAAEPLSVILQLEPEKVESTVTHASESLELSANVVPVPSVVAFEQNEELGTSHVLDDVAEVTVIGSGRVSSGLIDVVVALSVGEKGDGSLSSSTINEEATAYPSRV
ncbi:hypothetical protein Tco_1354154 [Tanacetum coccineum]